MLLTFAQFEREVTAERIRDKIAASKAKGMWMGGIPPLSYEPDGRSLAIVDEHAAIIRDIFGRYLELGNVRSLVEQLSRENVRVPRRIMRSGREIGGGVFGRGQIYALLSNPVYVGKVRHRGSIHEAIHPAIISREVWDKVQLQLASNAQGKQRGASEPTASPLAGRVFDKDGEPLVATHATKGRVRYCYYVSRSLHHGGETGPSAIRTPAAQLEKVIGEELATRLDQPLTLLGEIGIEVSPDEMNAVIAACATSASDLRRRTSSLLRDLAARVVIGRERVEVELTPRP